MINSQQANLIINALMAEMHQDLLTNDLTKVDEPVDTVHSILAEEDLTKGETVVTLSYCLAQATRQLRDESIERAPDSFGSLIVSDQEKYHLINSACLALVGKLIGHFLNPPDLGEIN